MGFIRKPESVLTGISLIPSLDCCRKPQYSPYYQCIEKSDIKIKKNNKDIE